MNFGVVKLIEGASLSNKDLTNIGLIPIGIDSSGNYVLVRIDDETMEETEIKERISVVESVEFVSGLNKRKLIETYTNHGQVSIGVTS